MKHAAQGKYEAVFFLQDKAQILMPVLTGTPLVCRKPVYVIGAERCNWKFAAFHKNLRHRGVVRALTGAEDVGFFYLCHAFAEILLIS